MRHGQQTKELPLGRADIDGNPGGGSMDLVLPGVSPEPLGVSVPLSRSQWLSARTLGPLLCSERNACRPFCPAGSPAGPHVQQQEEPVQTLTPAGGAPLGPPVQQGEPLQAWLGLLCLTSRPSHPHTSSCVLSRNGGALLLGFLCMSQELRPKQGSWVSKGPQLGALLPTLGHS